jgi:hypothetical protein
MKFNFTPALAVNSIRSAKNSGGSGSKEILKLQPVESFATICGK